MQPTKCYETLPAQVTRQLRGYSANCAPYTNRPFSGGFLPQPGRTTTRALPPLVGRLLVGRLLVGRLLVARLLVGRLLVARLLSRKAPSRKAP